MGLTSCFRGVVCVCVEGCRYEQVLIGTWRRLSCGISLQRALKWQPHYFELHSKINCDPVQLLKEEDNVVELQCAYYHTTVASYFEIYWRPQWPFAHVHSYKHFYQISFTWIFKPNFKSTWIFRLKCKFQLDWVFDSQTLIYYLWN